VSELEWKIVCVYKVFVMVGWLVADNAGKIDKYAFKCRVRLTQLQYLRTSYKDMKDIQFCCRYFWYTYLVMGQGQCERWTKWFDGWMDLIDEFRCKIKAQKERLTPTCQEQASRAGV